MSTKIINGYIVVNAFDDNSSYRGVDRLPWDLLDGHYYNHQLPDEIRRAFEAIRSNRNRGFWWPVCPSKSVSESLLAYTRSKGCAAELIAVFSPHLQSLAAHTTIKDESIVPIGTDVIAVGEWSLLRVLQESETPHLHDAIDRLTNQYGLLHDGRHARQIEDLYRELALSNAVEPIANENYDLPVDPVAVFLVTV